MATKPLPSQEVLRQLLRYEPETGKLFWRERGPEWFSDAGNGRTINTSTWNKRYAGTEALNHIDAYGHRMGHILGQTNYAHRVIWRLVTGDEPKNMIDHINGDGADNRLVNLREATSSQNQHNAGVRRDNRSGYKGVSWSKLHSKWRAYVNYKGKRHYFGLHANIEDARAAQIEAAARLHGEFARKT